MVQKLEFWGDFFNRYIWRGLDLGGKSPIYSYKLFLPWSEYRIKK